MVENIRIIGFICYEGNKENKNDDIQKSKDQEIR